MSFLMSTPLLKLLALLVLLPPTSADRFNTSTQRWRWATGTAGELRTLAAAANLRITDIELLSTRPPRYAAILVDNAGANRITWYFYTSLTVQKLDRATSRDVSRLIDFETYFLGRQPGARQLFSAVGVPNIGPRFSTRWGYSINFVAREIAPRLRRAGMIVDIDTYTLFGRRLYNFLTVAGARRTRKGQILLLHKSVAVIERKAAREKARIVDVERHDDGLYTAVIQKMTEPVVWYWLRGLAGKDINKEARARKARVYDLEPYRDNGMLKYDILLIENK